MMTEIEYEMLKRKIRLLTDIDLNNYKSNQIMRRLDGFIARTRGLDIAQYCHRLDHDREETVKLRNFLTINVSEFYRDQVHFDALRKAVFPELLKTSAKLNIWSAGCSDGQEPYSFAMILDELTPGIKHRILATDLDRESLSKAAAGGPYLPQDIRNVSSLLVTKYFTLKGDHYWVNDKIRERVTFSQQDLTRDAFPLGFDLISCRNVTIYFSNEAKAIMNTKFHNALKEHGVLFIGATETMLNASDLGFQRLLSCFYTKITNAKTSEGRELATTLSGGR
jgi:chemotaxis protein methyltransferase CheR